MTAKSVFRGLLLGVALVFVAMVSGLLAMRWAIHGHEVEIPRLVGMAPVEAERRLRTQGLRLEIEGRFYSADVPEGHIVSQQPPAGTKVRGGWRVRVAVSLGSQRAEVPSVVGQSLRVAEINVVRRGLEVGNIAVVHLPDLPEDQVVAQSPPPYGGPTASPRVNLLVTAPRDTEAFVMPDLVGQPLAEASAAVEQAGLLVGNVTVVFGEPKTGDPTSIAKPTVVSRQMPAPGTRVTPGTVVHFEITR
ncbi:MAG TPA: PASTA domain-containing protein [Terriglobales bacterium]|nr:PASTA domain-containing protein [Terriglobales bacterium]